MTNQKGLTLVEVLVAFVILTGALLAMGAFMTKFTYTVRTTGDRSVANELVADRLEEVKAATKYSSIDTLYAVTESNIPKYPKFTRKTEVKRVGGGPSDMVDYKIITVTVTSPALASPVKKSTVISFF